MRVMFDIGLVRFIRVTQLCRVWRLLGLDKTQLMSGFVWQRTLAALLPLLQRST